MMKKIWLLAVMVAALALSVACADLSKTDKTDGSFGQSTQQSSGTNSDVDTENSDSENSDSDVGQEDSNQKPSPVPPISNGGDYDFN